MRFDIGAKAWFKLFAELDECLLQVGNIVEYIDTKRIIFCLALSRFVVQQDKISYSNWTLSRTAPATSKSFNTNNQKLRKCSLQLTEINSTEINLRFKSIKQSCDAYHIAFQAICDGFFVFVAAIWHQARDGCRPAYSILFWLIQQFIGSYFMCIMPAWCLAFSGITNRVTYNNTTILLVMT